MGRDLVQMGENEWWIVETVSEYGSRCSKPFTSKEEAIETLRKGGCNEWTLKQLEDCGHVPSIVKGYRLGVKSFDDLWSPSTAISEALAKMDAQCPDGEHSLYEDVECARDGCTGETINWNGDESICWDCEDADAQEHLKKTRRQAEDN